MKTRTLTIIALLLLTGCGTLPSTVPTLDVTGSWAIYYYTETQTKDSMHLTQHGNVLRGIWSAGDTPTPVDITGSITGSTVCIDVPLPDVPCWIDAKVSKEGKATMEGTWTVHSGPLKGTHPWRAEKK